MAAPVTASQFNAVVYRMQAFALLNETACGVVG